MTKTTTLNLTFPHVGREHSEMYRVDSITGSVSFVPGQLLSKPEVEEILTYKKTWKVNMGRNREKQ